jgi:hypothetical protein
MARGSSKKLNRSRDLHIREKIRAAVILERLERQSLGELDPPMTKDQINASKIVLAKVIPDLQSVEMVAAVASITLTKEQRDAVAAAFARRND